MKRLIIRISIPLSILVLLVIFLLIYGGNFFHFQGERFSRRGDYQKALRCYQIIVERYPNYKHKPEILLQIAEIYHLKLNDCMKAKKVYQKIIKDFPSSEWGKVAQEKIRDVYDYFPLLKGNFWIEGDSETGGKNYLAEISCIEPNKVIKKIYAGKRLVATLNLTYKKTERELSEYEGEMRDGQLIFCYPLGIGDTWFSGEDLERAVYTVISKNEEVKTKSGKFSDCLKIRQEKKKASGSFRYDYYAPEVGRVLVTLGSERNPQEVRITELLSYKVVDPVD